MNNQFTHFLFIVILAAPFISWSQQVQVEMGQDEYLQFLRMRDGGANVGAAGTDCFSAMLGSVGRGLQATLEAEQMEAERMMEISNQYMELEQQCGNDLADLRMEMEEAEATHRELELRLPRRILATQLDYEESLLAIKQECEASSGEVFTQFRQQAGSGVITMDRGGALAAFMRGQTLDSFQKVFEMDCLTNKNNVQRMNILARRQSLQVAELRDEVEASAMQLARLAERLSFRQGHVVENCMRAEDQLGYQSELTRSMARRARSATRMQNFLDTLNATTRCISGPSNDTTTSGSGSRSRN
jgi:hypothetical protein